jgi:hypothetical protein
MFEHRRQDEQDNDQQRWEKLEGKMSKMMIG